MRERSGHVGKAFAGSKFPAFAAIEEKEGHFFESVIAPMQLWNLFQNMAKGIRSFIPVFRRVRCLPNPDAVEN